MENRQFKAKICTLMLNFYERTTVFAGETVIKTDDYYDTGYKGKKLKNI